MGMNDTAVRTIASNGKATITVTLADGTVKVLGGARAVRAEAALVTFGEADSSAHFALRGDLLKAQGEAASMVKGCKRNGYTYVFFNAYAIPVTEA